MFVSETTAKVVLLVLLGLLSFTISGQSKPTDNSDSQPYLFFTENVGQWDNLIRFRAGTTEATAWFAADGAYYQFSRKIAEDIKPDIPYHRQDSKFECLMIKTSFVGANGPISILGENRADYKCNYYLGNDQSRWKADVPNYNSIVYRNLYPGIDLKYYGNGSYMEYDFRVSPGADASLIQIRYEGIESLTTNSDGELEVTTIWGTIVEATPVIYQIDGERQVLLSGKYEILSDNSFGFTLNMDEYDAQLPLVIDPVLLFSTYLGGWNGDYGWGIEIDDAGDMYLSGQTTSATFPVLFPYQSTFAGATDVFVTKMRLDGTLAFSTFFGGSSQEEYPRLAMDDEYNLYISGRTYSADFPVYAGYSSALNGNTDVFAFKLNSTGNELIFSTFLGGRSDDFAGGLAVDTNHNLYVATYTLSDDFPLVNPFQTYPSARPASEDITVTKFSVNGTYLEYSTYLGSTEKEVAMGMAVDDNGYAYIHGLTYSPDFPLLNAYDSVLVGCDGILTKLTPEGNNLVFSTFLGGSENEWIDAIDLDAQGNIYAVGGTRSLDFPLVNPFQTEMLGGAYSVLDDFVTKFNAAGNALIYSTYLGGTGDDYAQTIKVDDFGIAFITGFTYSTDFPVANPVFATLTGPTDVYLTALSTQGNELAFGTYLGGSEVEEGYSITIDNLRRVHVTGYTGSEDFPLVNPFQSTIKASYDAFVSVFEIGCCLGTTGNVAYETDDRFDLRDCIYYLQWLFSGGPAPKCEAEADFDGNGRLDLSDVLDMIQYLFTGEPAPAPCP